MNRKMTIYFKIGRSIELNHRGGEKRDVFDKIVSRFERWFHNPLSFSKYRFPDNRTYCPTFGFSKKEISYYAIEEDNEENK